MHTLGHLAIGVLGHHDATVDEHAKPQQHAEHHHEIERIAKQVDDSDGKQQRKWNAQADHDAAAKAHRCHDDNHNHGQRCQYIAFELLYLNRGEFRLILRGNNFDTGGQRSARCFDACQNIGDAIDDVGVRTFFNTD